MTTSRPIPPGRNTRLSWLALACACVLPLGGCATMLDSAVDKAAARTGEGIGDAVGKKAGEAAGLYVASRFPDMWTVQLQNLWVSYLFGMAGHSGGYSVGGRDYAAGEATTWRRADSNEAKPDILERAFLKKEDDGRQWWRVKLTDGDTGDVMTLEGLFSPDATKLVRLRGKMPKETEAKEMPVQEGAVGFVKPTPLSAESIKGATVGTESITVPAGTYQADHVKYGAVDGGTLEWWMQDAIPGGVVKYRRTAGRGSGKKAGEGAPDPYNWSLELVSTATGAGSELGSF